MAHAGHDGRRPGFRLPGSARRRSDAPNRRWLRRFDASRQVLPVDVRYRSKSLRRGDFLFDLDRRDIE